MLAYYWLKSAPSSPVKLELVDSSGKVAVCAASDAPVKPVDTEAINVQAYWEQPAPPPSADAGMHRFALNLAAPRLWRRRPPRTGSATPSRRLPSPGNASASQQRAARRPGRGAPILKPGEYTVRLTVDGKTYTQPVTVKPDTRGVADGAAPPANGSDDDM